MQKCLEDNLSITMGAKGRSLAFQLLPQLSEIEDLAVVNDDRVATGAIDWLVSARDVENGESCRSQRDRFALERPPLVRPPMSDRFHR